MWKMIADEAMTYIGGLKDDETKYTTASSVRAAVAAEHKAHGQQSVGSASSLVSIGLLTSCDRQIEGRMGSGKLTQAHGRRPMGLCLSRIHIKVGGAYEAGTSKQR